MSEDSESVRPQFVLFASSFLARETGHDFSFVEEDNDRDTPVQPSLVIVHFGSEDSTCRRPHSSGLGPHVPLDEYVANMRKIANHLKTLSKQTRFIFLSTPPVNEETIPEDRDGVHLSAEGNKAVHREILKAIKREATWKLSLYWTKMTSDFGEDSPYDPVARDGKTTINVSNYAFHHPAFWGEPNLSTIDIMPQFI